MSADVSLLCCCWSFQIPSRGHNASYSINIVGCSSEGYPSNPISTWSTNTYRRPRSVSLSFFSPLFSVSLLHTQTHQTMIWICSYWWEWCVWCVQLSWEFRIYPTLTMGNVWSCRLVMLQCSGPLEWLPFQPSSTAVSNMIDSVLFSSAWNRSTGLTCAFWNCFTSHTRGFSVLTNCWESLIVIYCAGLLLFFSGHLYHEMDVAPWS